MWAKSSLIINYQTNIKFLQNFNAIFFYAKQFSMEVSVLHNHLLCIIAYLKTINNSSRLSGLLFIECLVTWNPILGRCVDCRNKDVNYRFGISTADLNIENKFILI